MRTTKHYFLFLLTVGLELLSSIAYANGRFPSARYLVVGPGPNDTSQLVLQTTFGIVQSNDGGRTWRWACELALGFSDMYDPSIVLNRDGSVVVSLPNGITTTDSVGCNYIRPATAPATTVLDLSSDLSGNRVVAALAPIGQPNGVAISDDQGQTWRTTWMMDNFFVDTIDVVQNHPNRIYLSGLLFDGTAILLRSDDNGQQFTEITRSFGNGLNAYITAVSANNPDVIYVRSDIITGGTILLRSTNGGQDFQELTRTRSRMLGVAVSDDDQTIWVGSAHPLEGIFRSTDGGQSFQSIYRGFTTLCLRYHAGILFACADNRLDGFSLATSTDQGEHFQAILNFVDLPSPDACPGGTSVGGLCGDAWNVLRPLVFEDAGGAIPPRVLPDGAVIVPSDAAFPYLSDARMDIANTESSVIDANSTDLGTDSFDSSDVMGSTRIGFGGGGNCSCTTQGRREKFGHSTLMPLFFILLFGVLDQRKCNR